MKTTLLAIFGAILFISTGTAQIFPGQDFMFFMWNSGQLGSGATLNEPLEESGYDSDLISITSLNFSGSTTSSYVTSTDSAYAFVSYTSTFADYSFTSIASSLIQVTAGIENYASAGFSGAFQIISTTPFSISYQQSGEYHVAGLPEGIGSLTFASGTHWFYPSMSVGSPLSSEVDFNQSYGGYCNFTVTAIPEPSTTILLLIGLVGMAFGIVRSKDE